MPKITERGLFFHIGDIVDLLYMIFANFGEGKPTRTTVEFMIEKATEAELKSRDLKEYLESLLITAK